MFVVVVVVKNVLRSLFISPRLLQPLRVDIKKAEKKLFLQKKGQTACLLASVYNYFSFPYLNSLTEKKILNNVQKRNKKQNWA